MHARTESRLVRLAAVTLLLLAGIATFSLLALQSGASADSPSLPEPVDISDHLEPVGYPQITYDSTPVENGPAGTIKIVGTGRNISDQTFANLFIRITHLSHKLVGLNCDSGEPQGVGCEISVPWQQLGDDGVLSPGEEFTMEGLIGRPWRGSWEFKFEVWGTPAQNSSDVVTRLLVAPGGEAEVAHPLGAIIKAANSSLPSGGAISIKTSRLENPQKDTPTYGPIYDISVGGGGVNDPLLLSLPLPEFQGAATGRFSIIHQLEDGTWETLPSIIRDGYVLAEADSFSHYSIGKTRQGVIVDGDGKSRPIELRTYRGEDDEEWVRFFDPDTNEELQSIDLNSIEHLFTRDNEYAIGWWPVAVSLISPSGIPAAIWIAVLNQYVEQEYQSLLRESVPSEERIHESWNGLATLGGRWNRQPVVLSVDQFRRVQTVITYEGPWMVVDPRLSPAEDGDLVVLVLHNGKVVGAERRPVDDWGSRHIPIDLSQDDAAFEPLDVFVLFIAKEPQPLWKFWDLEQLEEEVQAAFVLEHNSPSSCADGGALIGKLYFGSTPVGNHPVALRDSISGTFVDGDWEFDEPAIQVATTASNGEYALSFSSVDTDYYIVNDGTFRGDESDEFIIAATPIDFGSDQFITRMGQSCNFSVQDKHVYRNIRNIYPKQTLDHIPTVSVSTSISWDAFPQATSYTVALFRGSNDIEIQRTRTINTVFQPDQPLVNGEIYRFYVDASDRNGESIGNGGSTFFVSGP